ncbi:hypothetical protein [Lederbergia citri]|uniref:Uncharacterized protein n=1 Tax=Lederbergia citri TaxID=2833580 RepID=A0A942YIH3_9BACI|nr:hypothetical protein [Lederbergia citri]MBS4195381.1 hypothetical protein [Lederbergia citri]
MESCLYCGKRTKLFPVKMWNKDIYRYYCDEHYGEAFQFEKEERRRFIEYYSVPERRKWLSKESLELWEKLKTSSDIGI